MIRMIGTNLVLNGAGDGGLGCVRGTLALLVGETGRHDRYFWCCWLWFDLYNVVVMRRGDGDEMR